MKKSKATIVLVSILVLAMTVGATFGANAAAIVSVKIDGTYSQTEARSMLDTVNSFRASDENWYWNEDDTTKSYCSKKALVYDYELEKIAMQRAAELAVLPQHTRPDGSSCFTAFTEKNLKGAKAENIIPAKGSVDSATAFDLWKEDANQYAGQGHRRNMLSDKYTAIGIAKFTYQGKDFWVQEFYATTVNTTKTTANDGAATVSVNVDSSKLADYGVDNLPTYPAVVPSTNAPSTTKATTTKATTKPASTKPKATKIKSLTAGKKQFKVKWNKVSGVKGYEVQISTSSKFTKKTTKTKKIKKATVTALTVKSLKSKKKYYVRVRTYNSKGTSKWSAKKSVKVK